MNEVPGAKTPEADDISSFTETVLAI